MDMAKGGLVGRSRSRSSSLRKRRKSRYRLEEEGKISFASAEICKKA